MERVGLVAQVEAELEKMLALGLLPADGKFPSEHGLARCFGVSRGTVREAIRSLSTRGLVVHYPGRRTRVVAWGEALNLETLSVALTGDGRLLPGRHHLLEGFLALKREITVELLVACGERASPADLEQLSQACFELEDKARWDAGDGKWVRQEFNLLKLAASVADRMGHLLLIQSLERTFSGMAKWILPHLNTQAVQSWARCAMEALEAKNVQALRQQLSPLLQRVEERLVRSLEPGHAPMKPPEPPPTVAELSPASEATRQVGPSLSRPKAEKEELEEQVVANLPKPKAAKEGGREQVFPNLSGPGIAREGVTEPVASNLSNNRAGLGEVLPTEAPLPEPVPAGGGHEPESAEPGQVWPPGAEEDSGDGTYSPPDLPWAKPLGRGAAPRWMPPTMGLTMPLTDPE